MSTKTLKIAYPEDLPESMGKSEKEFENEVQFLVAAKLYELGKISSGRAAEMAKMNRVAFLESLQSYHISALNYSLEELEREIEDANTRANNKR